MQTKRTHARCHNDAQRLHLPRRLGIGAALGNLAPPLNLLEDTTNSYTDGLLGLRAASWERNTLTLPLLATCFSQKALAMLQMSVRKSIPVAALRARGV